MADAERRPGRIVVKAFALDTTTGERLGKYPSKQVLDPFQGVAAYGQTLRMPPLNMEQLIQLAEAHPMHAASLEQKVNDIVASGLQLVPKEGAEDVAKDENKKKILEWWEELTEEYTSLEVMQAVWNDYETVGWGALEIARDLNGVAQRIYHVPGHTLRAHMNGYLFAQWRQGKIVWFKRWGSELAERMKFYATSGRRAPDDLDVSKEANDILVFRKPARRTTWYGIPVYVSGIGHIAMGIAARDFNVRFFENYREPRHLIVITGLAEDVEQAADDIELIWKEQLKDSPHHNVILPISGDAKVVIEKMGLPMNDMHFSRMMEQVDSEVLVAHRMPPSRLGIEIRGFLGGSIAQVVNTIYKDGVVGKGQVVLESRLQRFVETEYAKKMGTEEKDFPFKVDFEDLDVTDEELDVSIGIELAKSNTVTLNEARNRLGFDKHDPFGEMTLAEYLTSIGAGGTAMAAMFGPSALLEPTQKQINEEVMRKLERIDEYIEELISGDTNQLPHLAGTAKEV